VRAGIDAARSAVAVTGGEAYRLHGLLLPDGFGFAMIHSIDPQHRPETIVVVPCYNEARRLNPHAFSAFLDKYLLVTLLFVDDGSTDDTPLTVDRLRQLHPRQVCTLRLSENVGKAEAVRRGVQIALRRRPAMVGYWDADLATPLDAIPQFCDVLRARPNISLVMGSRVALLGRQIRRRGMRHFLGRAFATAASIVLRLPVYDTQCGAKLFRVTPATVDVFSRPFGARWIFDVEILARMITSKSHAKDSASPRDSIYEYPLERWEDVDGSRLKPRDFLAATVDLAAIYWRYAGRGYQPGRVLPSVVEHPEPNTRRRDAA
jgi:glycosyltransferase involved in cell wall biosynthesis